MGFSFKNLDTGYTYTLNEIDEIAAKFWGKEVDPRAYAYPGERIYAPNWFDMLGHPIEDLQYFVKNEENHTIYKRSKIPHEAVFDMREVASLMLNDNTRYIEGAEKMFAMLKFIKPYVEFCFHLKSLGIVGVGHGW